MKPFSLQISTRLKLFVRITFAFKGVLNDQCGLVCTSLRSAASHNLDTHRHTIKSGDLIPSLCHWSFRIKGVPKRPGGLVRTGLSVRRRRPLFAQPLAECECRRQPMPAHNQIWRSHSVPASLVISE